MPLLLHRSVRRDRSPSRSAARLALAASLCAALGLACSTISVTSDFDPSYDFSRLKTRFPYVMVMPQVAFLNYLHDQAARYPEFRCVLGAGVQQLLETDGRVTGVRYRHDGEEHELRAKLRSGDLSGLELARPVEGDAWQPLHDTPLFAQEVPHTGDTWAAARRRAA